MVRELPRTNSEQGMYEKLPTLFGVLNDESDPIVLGVNLKPTRKQWNRSPIWNESKNNTGGGELYDMLPNLCVLLQVGYPVLLDIKFLDTVCAF